MKRNSRLLAIMISIMLVVTACGDLYMIEPDMKSTVDMPEKSNTTVVSGDKEPEKEKTEESKATKEEETTIDSKTETKVIDETEEIEKAEQSETKETEESTTDVEFLKKFKTDEAYGMDIELEELSTEEVSFWFNRNKEHAPVTSGLQYDREVYGVYFIGPNTEEKVMYLTFDEGYENGYTETILDTLKEANVKATFFVTGLYVKSQPELVKRMKEEGHLVANHSYNHPSMATLSTEEIYAEINDTAELMLEKTGYEMDLFFRPPAGKYSEKSLYLTRKLGYRNIFWSMAFKDWDVNEQPGKDGSYDHVMTNYHNGAIILLHAVSESNTEALPDILRDLKAEGYRFGSLYELEQ